MHGEKGQLVPSRHIYPTPSISRGSKMAVAQGRKVSISLRVRDNDHGSPSNIWHRQWYSLPKKHPPTKRGRGGPFAARCTAAAHNKVKRPDGASVLPSGRPTRPDRALGIPPTDVCRAGHCQEWRPLLRFPSLRICGEISPSREMWDNGSVGVRPMWSRRRRIYLNARRRGRPNR